MTKTSSILLHRISNSFSRYAMACSAFLKPVEKERHGQDNERTRREPAVAVLTVKEDCSSILRILPAKAIIVLRILDLDIGGLHWHQDRERISFSNVKGVGKPFQQALWKRRGIEKPFYMHRPQIPFFYFILSISS